MCTGKGKDGRTVRKHGMRTALVLAFFWMFSGMAAMCASASENDTLSQLIGVAQSLITAGNENAADSVSGEREENYVSTEDLLLEGENSTEENGAAEQAVTDAGNSYNILLVGSDRRDDSWNGNSDTMILVTVNYDSSRISMVSFMRDLGVDIPGNGTQKLNAAFAVGGISLLEDTLRTNFNVRIDNYAAVDFYEMIDIIDSLGGVNMEVRDEEVDVVNMYIMSMCPYMGLNENDYLLSSGGYLHLNGMQAVAFCRVRFVGDNDYERTERQRRVLTALLGSFNPGSPDDVTALLKELLINVDTDLTPVSMLKIAPLMMNLSSYEMQTSRVPFDGMYSSQGEMLMPSQPETNQMLHRLLYE